MRIAILGNGGFGTAMALTLERITRELDDLPLRDHVWESFLAGNARRLLGLS